MSGLKKQYVFRPLNTWYNNVCSSSYHKYISKCIKKLPTAKIIFSTFWTCNKNVRPSFVGIELIACHINI